MPAWGAATHGCRRSASSPPCPCARRALHRHPRQAGAAVRAARGRIHRVGLRPLSRRWRSGLEPARRFPYRGGMNTTTLLVRQDALATTELRSTAPAPLADGQVRVRVERFALTANNITYAAMGEMLEYWRFFPSGEPGWGIVPVWGFGMVTESLHADVAVGERLYGYWPMASEAVLSPHKTSATDFADGAARACTRSTTTTCAAAPTLSTVRTTKTCRPCCGRCSSPPGSSTTSWPTRASTARARCCCPAPQARRPTAQPSSSPSARACR